MRKKREKIPADFKYLFWWLDFSKIDPLKNKKLIIVQVLNYGDLKHWQWLVKTYGKNNLKREISKIPKSEFRKQVIPLIKLLFDIKKFKYETRSAKIRAEKNI